MAAITKAQLAVFLTNAVTRTGIPHTITTVQNDVNGNPQTIKGTITPNNADGTPGTGPVTMFWGANGIAKGNDGYSLVTPQAFADFVAANPPVTPAPAPSSTPA